MQKENRHYLWKLTVTVILFAVLLPLAGKEKLFTLYKGGDPDAALLHPGATYAKDLASFQSILKKVYGKTLPVVKNAKEAKGKKLISFQIKKDFDPRTNDRFSFTFAPNGKSMTVKATQVSIVWAFNHILEEGAGVKFLFPEECGTAYTAKKELALPAKNYVSPIPSFYLKRFVERSHNSWYPKSRYKQNFPINHEITTAIFPGKHYNKVGWPKEIMPVLRGKKLVRPQNLRAYWQPCYSHPETARLAIENIKKYLSTRPNQQSISLVQNDCGCFCECANCIKANGGKHYSKSEVYFKWVNAVAEGVSKAYPKIVFVAGAYVETQAPPSFKLHKNVLALLTQDLFANTDPATMKAKKAYFKKWSSKASMLGVWDYAWGHGYVMPRVYFKIHAEMIKFLYDNNCRLYFSENECQDAKEGPKGYLVNKLIWDVNCNVDKVLDEWYLAAGGKKAAPYLKKYYAVWEKFWTSPRIKKTPWYQNLHNVYMRWGENTHMYGADEKIIQETTSLMRKAVANAVTPQEKTRMKLLERHHDYMVAVLRIHGAGVLPPDCNVKNAKEAVAILRYFKEIPKYAAERNRLAKIFKADPVMGHSYRGKIYNRRIRFDESLDIPMGYLLARTYDFATDPMVQKELKGIAKTPAIPAGIREIASFLTAGGKTTNILPCGNMEKMPDEKILFVHKSHKAVAKPHISALKAIEGKNSLAMTPGTYSLIRMYLPAQPSTRYMLSFYTYSEDDTKANIRYAIYPSRNHHNQAWYDLPRKKLVKGKWQHHIYIMKMLDNSDAINGFIFLNDFPKGRKVYVDDIKILQMK